MVMPKLLSDLGQMFLIGFDGLSIKSGHPVIRAIEHENLGGVILFDRNINGSRQNIESSGQLKQLVSVLQQHAEIPLLIATDQEGGQVCRLKAEDGFPASRSAGSLSRCELPEATVLMGKMAATLAEHGINLNLAPVVDLAINPANPIISQYDRSFGNSVDLVVRYASQFIKAHHLQGVACCLKHFPGHGSSKQDSHLGFVDITDSWQDRELGPYRQLFAAGYTDAVMTAHVVHRALDPQGLPATLSKDMLYSLLRRQLGFSGLIISDDLQMKAISHRWNFEDAVHMAVLAGVDLLVVGNNLVRDENVTARGIRAIEKLLTTGQIKEKSIDESLARIAALKKKIAGEEAWKENRHTALS